MARKPIVGVAGGIGSGKSTVARMIADEGGGLLIDADASAKRILNRADVADRLVQWWGEGILGSDGLPDRRRIAERVFDDPEQRKRLEGLIHPLVAAERDEQIARAQENPAVRLVVLDVPLLFEVGLDALCDRVIYVDTPREVRLARLRETRGWDEKELARRENNQLPLDRKRNSADDIVDNSNGADACLAQVRQLLASFPDHNR